MAPKKAICKGCGGVVLKPVICGSCNIESHPGQSCLARTGHPWHLGVLLDCESDPLSVLPGGDSDASSPSGASSSLLREVLQREINLLGSLIRDEIKRMREDFLRETSSLLGSVSALSDRVVALEERVGGPSREDNSCSLLEEAVAEVEERQRRSRNVLFFNLEENALSSSDGLGDASQRGEESDRRRVAGILEKIISKESVSIKTRRIGRVGEGRIRPIVVTLPSPEVTLSILRNKHRYSGNVRITQDRTPQQRKYLADLRSQLQGSGDESLEIRYRNGRPALVKKNTSQSKN